MKKLLHLGLSGLSYFPKKIVYHHPIIQLVGKELDDQLLSQLHLFENIVITSKSSCEYFLKKTLDQLRSDVKIFSIGPKTTAAIEELGLKVFQQAKTYTQEGVIALFEGLEFQLQNVLFPRSNLARDKIDAYFQKFDLNYLPIICYQTLPNPNFSPLNLGDFDEIFFTCPSSVKFFFEKYAELPKDLEIHVIGEITYNYLIHNRVINNKINVLNL